MEEIKTAYMDKRGLPSARSKLLDIMEKKEKRRAENYDIKIIMAKGHYFIESAESKKNRVSKNKTKMIMIRPEKKERGNIGPAVFFA